MPRWEQPLHFHGWEAIAQGPDMGMEEHFPDIQQGLQASQPLKPISTTSVTQMAFVPKLWNYLIVQLQTSSAHLE